MLAAKPESVLIHQDCPPRQKSREQKNVFLLQSAGVASLLRHLKNNLMKHLSYYQTEKKP